MTSTSGDRLEASSTRTRRLSLLPAILGLSSIALLLATAQVVLPDEPAWTGTAVIIAVLAVAVTVVSGYPVGLYTGLLVYAVAMVGGEIDSSTRSLAVAAVTMLVAHELIRVSLDARRPARFGPRFWTRFALRTAALSAAVAGIAWFAGSVSEWSLPPWVVPIGLASAAFPLLAWRLIGNVGSGPLSALVMVAVALAIAALTIGGAVPGSVARSQIERSTTTTVGLDQTSVTVPPSQESPDDEASVLEPLASIVLFFVTMLIVGAIIVALRRRAMDFDLDELDMDQEDATLGFAGPGHADLDDDDVEIGEEDLDRLLAGLALDISGERDPGRAIRYAYANTERGLAELEIVREESETEQEFLTRAMPTLGTQGTAMVELTDLFEQARFGHLPVSEAMRARALAAVEQLRQTTVPVETSEERQ